MLEKEERTKSWEARSSLVLSEEEMLAKEELLVRLNFVYIPGTVIQMGTPDLLPCRFEGNRKNEGPVRKVNVAAFWVCKYAVTNAEFEEYNPRRVRPPTSRGDRQPVTNVTYLNALQYARFLSGRYGLLFTLPTEPEWVAAAAPTGWEYPYHEGRIPDPRKANNFVFGQSAYETVGVDDPRFGANVWGLFHMGGNVQEYTLGSYYTEGSWGAETDGLYCVVKGGDFGHCPLSSGVHRRGIFDVSGRSERLGFRLAHPDLRRRNE